MKYDMQVIYDSKEKINLNNPKTLDKILIAEYLVQIGYIKTVKQYLSYMKKVGL